MAKARNVRYGKKTSAEGEYRQTGNFTYRKQVQGNRNVPQHFKNAQGAYYTWFPKQAAPAPAPTQATSAPAPAPLPVNNPYKAEADRLLKTIKEMEAAKPKAIFNNASPVSPSNQLQVSSASSPNKTSGTSNFKRRAKTTTTPTNILRTIQSVNV